MKTALAQVRFGAALPALFALGCLSTGEPLFRDEAGPAELAESASSTLPVAAPPNAPMEPAAQPPLPLPEQLVDFRREVARAPAIERGVSASAPPAEIAPLPAEVAPAEVAPAEVAPDDCGGDGAILCDGFDDMLEGVFPSGEGWLPELPGCGGSHVVDALGPAFSGAQAMRAGDGGYPECMLHAELSGENDIYVRTRVFLEGGGPLLSQYVSLIEFGSLAQRDDPELRVGVRPAIDNLCPGIPGVDVTGSGLAGGPATECTGFALEPERWYCVEARFTRTGSALSLRVAVDGAELVARDFTATPAWGGAGLFVKLGRASYGASSRGSVWHDDVAVGREPLPCAP